MCFILLLALFSNKISVLPRLIVGHVVTSPFKSMYFQIFFCKNYCRKTMEGTSMELVPDESKLIYAINIFYSKFAGWLGWAMVLGSFQCRGILLLLHIVGQGPAVLAAGAGRVGYIFYIFHLSSISNVLSFGRWLNMTEIL